MQSKDNEPLLTKLHFQRTTTILIDLIFKIIFLRNALTIMYMQENKKHIEIVHFLNQQLNKAN